MTKFPVFLAISLLLSACAHNIYIVGRKSGAIATATIITAGNKSGDIELVLKGKTYKGRWVYMSSGGAIGLSAASAFSGAYSAFGSGMMAMGSTLGNGTVLAAAPDGSKLHCMFTYNDWGKTGYGECKDSEGETYDLQIS